jgi:beta-phosphoglucomutase-like phosphatase (HAD superfamily)
MPLTTSHTRPPSLKKPVAVIFDMDGVLFDTERFYQEAALIVGKDMGCAIPASLLERVVGLSWPGTRALFVDTFGRRSRWMNSLLLGYAGSKSWRRHGIRSSPVRAN